MRLGRHTERQACDTRVVVAALAVMAVAALAMLAVGTLLDLTISKSAYAPANPLLTILSTLGLLPMAVPICILMGALARCVREGNFHDALRRLGFWLSMASSAALGFLLVQAIPSIDGLGPLLGSPFPDWAAAALGVPLGVGLAWLGCSCTDEKANSDAMRRIIVVVAALVLSLLLVELLKGAMMRPRYRTIVASDDGSVPFVPWYRRCMDARRLMTEQGIAETGFRSFPSAHAVQAASVLTSYLGLVVVWPGLRRRRKAIVVAAFLFVVMVMACRIALGAHFLSDVGAGMLSAALFGIAACVIIDRMERGCLRRQAEPDGQATSTSFPKSV